jgi:putative transposase
VAVDGRSNDKVPFGGDATGPNPTDRAKLGTKRSLQTDGMGVPIGLAIAGANRNDFKMVKSTMESVPVRRPSSRRIHQHLCLDKGYDYVDVYDLTSVRGYESHIAQRVNSPVERKRTPGRRKPRRWVVERTHSWMNRYRRLLVRWEKKGVNYLGFVHFVCGIIAFRAAGVYG